MTAWRLRHGARSAFSGIALRAAQAPYDISEFRVPTGETCQGFRTAAPRVATFAPQVDHVLTEFVAQPDDR